MVADPPISFKHVFVTGATGIVGVPLCEKLTEIGVAVTAYSRTTGNFGFPPGVRHARGDVQDAAELAKAATGADVIFHLAAAVHGSASTMAEFENINIEGTENVARLAIENGARLVHVSTVNVDGFRRGILTDAYAATKARAEELVIDAIKDGLDAVIVRPAAVFGNVEGRAGLIVDRLLSGSLRVLPAPSRLISPVWADDLAEALVGAAKLGKTGETYTVAGPAVSTGDFVKSVSAAADVSAPRASIPSWAVVAPLRLAWLARRITRWTPPVSAESVRSNSVHDGRSAARHLDFEYTPISEIFSA